VILLIFFGFWNSFFKRLNWYQFLYHFSKKNVLKIIVV
jgi:hypothetical protein